MQPYTAYDTYDWKCKWIMDRFTTALQGQGQLKVFQVNDSMMKDDGIRIYDVVVYDNAIKPCAGNLVVASVNGVTRVRRLAGGSPWIFTTAWAQKLSPSYFAKATDKVVIHGVVVSVIKDLSSRPYGDEPFSGLPSFLDVNQITK